MSSTPKYSWAATADGSYRRRCVGLETFQAFLFGAMGQERPIADYSQGASPIGCISVAVRSPLTTAAVQRAWLALRYRYPTLAAHLHIDGPLAWSLSYLSPISQAEAERWAAQTVVEKPRSERRPLFDWLDAGSKLSNGFVELYWSATDDPRRYELGIKGCHVLVDGHGIFVLLGQLLDVLADGPPENHFEWGREVERLRLPIAAILGRTDEQPLSPAAQDYLNVVGKAMSAPMEEWPLYVRQDKPDAADAVACYKTWTASDSARVFNWAKSHAVTVTELYYALWPLALCRATGQMPHSDSTVLKSLFPVDARRWLPSDHSGPTENCSGVSMAIAPLGQVPTLLTALDADPPVPADLIAASRAFLQRTKRDSTSLLVGEETYAAMLSAMLSAPPPDRPKGLTLISCLLPLERFVNREYGGGDFVVSEPRIANFNGEGFSLRLHTLTFRDCITLQVASHTAYLEAALIQRTLDEFDSLLRKVIAM